MVNWHMVRRPRRAAPAVTVLLAFLAMMTAGGVSSATLTAQLQARIGPGGANGTSTLNVFSTGAGSVSIALKGLAHGTVYTETIYKGTCSKPSTKLLTLPTFKTTSTGKAVRTNTLTVAQTSKVNRAGEVIRFVAGSRAVCGAFSAVELPPPPPPPAAIAATTTIGLDPTGVTVTPTGVLVANWYDGTLSRVDPATNSVLASLPLTVTGNEGPQSVTYGEGAVWVGMDRFDEQGMNIVASSVERVDPVSGQVVATIPVGKGAFDITTGPGAVWVTDYLDAAVTRIDPATNQVSATVPVGAGASGVTFGLDAVWVSSEKAGTVSRIDPATNQIVATIPTISAPEGITTGAGSVWVANYGHRGQSDGVLSRIDPTTNQVVRTIPVGTNPGFVTFAGGFVWVAMNGETTVVQVNPATNTVQAKVSSGVLEIGADGKVLGFWGIAATDHSVWVTKPQPGDAFTLNVPLPGELVRINY